MKAISLHQPWASAVALGYKRMETRSWATAYRGPLAIQAAKKRNSITTHMEAVIRNDLGLHLPDPLPRGVVVAVVDLVGCHLMTTARIADQTPLELALGDWRLGRYAWELADIRPVLPPVEARGFQQVWNLPDLTTLDVMTFAQVQHGRHT